MEEYSVVFTGILSGEDLKDLAFSYFTSGSFGQLHGERKAQYFEPLEVKK